MTCVVDGPLVRRALPEDFARFRVERDHHERVSPIASFAVRVDEWTPFEHVRRGRLPGTTAPSTNVVRKMCLFQTTGDEYPRPDTGVFHKMFLVGPHSDGSPVSAVVP